MGQTSQLPYILVAVFMNDSTTIRIGMLRFLLNMLDCVTWIMRSNRLIEHEPDILSSS